MIKKSLLSFLVISFLLVLTSCGKNGFTVGGIVIGLENGEKIAIELNEMVSIGITENSEFKFSTPLPDGSFYDVKIVSAPVGKYCSIGHNEGYINGANITNVDIVCSTDFYSVGGTVTGLGVGESLVIQNNLDDDTEITTNGSFVFNDYIAFGGRYHVTILTNGTVGKTCTVSNSNGTIVDQNISDVTITCSVNSYALGGTMVGLDAGDSIILRNNGGDDLTLTTDGAFTFTTELAHGSEYSVSIFFEPVGKNCTVANGTGAITSDVDNVTIECVEGDHPIIFTSFTNFSAGGNLGGVRGADSYCKRDPKCPVFGNCKALLVDKDRVACITPNCAGGAVEHKDWVLRPNTTYVRYDRETVIGITNRHAIFEVPLTNSIIPATPTSFAWTGLSTDWITELDHNCNNWTSKLYSDYSRLGWANKTNYDAFAIMDTEYRCSPSFVTYVYCVEQ